MAKKKVVKEPRISVNKLGEYLTSNNPSRRMKILEDQKYPKDSFGPTRYKDAREAIIKYIISGYDKKILKEALVKLNKKTAFSDFEINDKENSIAVVETVLKTKLPVFKGAKLSRYKGRNPKIVNSNVDISIMPDIVVKANGKVGCLKVHIIKTHPLSSEGQKYVSTLLHQFTEENLLDKAHPKADTKLSISIDCFGKTHEIAPTSVMRRKSKIHDACRVIEAIWKSL